MLRIVMTFVLLTIVGCEYLDAAMGVSVDPKTKVVTVDPAGGPAGTVLGVAKDAGSGTPIGAIASVGLLIINLYQGFRSKALKDALVSTAVAVEGFASSPEGAAVGKVLKSRLANQHGHDNVGRVMSAVVKRLPKKTA